MAENSKGREGKGTGERSRTSNRGFASMSPEQQREIASKGGQAAHRKGVAHEWTSEEARAAGRKGGQASRSGNRQNSEQQPRNPEDEGLLGNTSATNGDELKTNDMEQNNLGRQQNTTPGL